MTTRKEINLRNATNRRIRKAAKLNGISPRLAHRRIREGWSFKRATTEPSKKSAKPDKPAIDLSVSQSSYYKRRKRGWGRFQAALTPAISSEPQSDEIKIAKLLGLNPETVRHRLKAGAEDIFAPAQRPQPVANSVRSQCRELGIKYDTYFSLRRKGLSKEMALDVAPRTPR
jgi:hypothetical protein